MNDLVKAAFSSFQQTFEGASSCMYLDIKGLVTAAIGCLIEPLTAEVLALPWEWRINGKPATQLEITDEWRRIKADQLLRFASPSVWQSMTALVLPPKAIDALVVKRAAAFDAILTRRFPDYPQWPSDAQLGVLSMSWAMGANFDYPHFASAALKQDFAACAKECAIGTVGNPGVIPRNAANVKLFNNAAQVIIRNMDRSKLWYPMEIAPVGDVT